MPATNSPETAGDAHRRTFVAASVRIDSAPQYHFHLLPRDFREDAIAESRAPPGLACSAAARTPSPSGLSPSPPTAAAPSRTAEPSPADAGPTEAR